MATQGNGATLHVCQSLYRPNSGVGAEKGTTSLRSFLTSPKYPYFALSTTGTVSTQSSLRFERPYREKQNGCGFAVFVLWTRKGVNHIESRKCESPQGETKTTIGFRYSWKTIDGFRRDEFSCSYRRAAHNIWRSRLDTKSNALDRI
jgi:hypothetical protein